MNIEAIDAVQTKLVERDLTPVQLEALYAELPLRGTRTDEEIAVAIAISRQYRVKLQPAHELLHCRGLASEYRLRIDATGRYIALHGEPLDLVSDRCDVIDHLLETRLSCDFFELWEEAGGSVDRDADTDAFARFVVEEVARRCDTENTTYCAHNPRW
ncbi:hypothetical protein ACFWHR_07745 [Leucobacter sp. NPDC058333]|uniref:hypothetical protein n=1 Tax=Leucobacter sp. NPDC058333 TaxID=3346450 RepID=UPI00365CD936